MPATRLAARSIGTQNAFSRASSRITAENTETIVSVTAISASHPITGSPQTLRKPIASAPAWPPMPLAEIAASASTASGSATIFSSTK